jgi:hypothetical protein
MVTVDTSRWVVVAEQGQGETDGSDEWDRFYEFPFWPEG